MPDNSVSTSQLEAIREPIVGQLPGAAAVDSPLPKMMEIAWGTNGADTMLLYYVSALDVRIRRAALAIENSTSPSNFSAEPNSNDNGESIANRKKMLVQVKEAFCALEEKCTKPIALEEISAIWNEAYRIERLTVFIEPMECLWAEVKRRLGEAAEESVLSLARLNAAVDALGPMVFASNSNESVKPGSIKPEFEDQVRSLLLDIIEETHWDIQRKFYSRPIRKQATRRIVLIGMCAFVLLIVPYVLIYGLTATGHIRSIERWSWIPLYSALTAGLFGALFSRLLYLQQRWDTLTIGGLKDAREFTSIFLRGCVGMTGAVIVSFFLMSKVVEGALFPNFQNIGLDTWSYHQQTQTVTKNATPPQSNGATNGKPDEDPEPEIFGFRLIFPSKDLALLIVWSFLAGFSERLIPTILQDTEVAIRGKKAK